MFLDTLLTEGVHRLKERRSLKILTRFSTSIMHFLRSGLLALSPLISWRTSQGRRFQGLPVSIGRSSPPSAPVIVTER